MTKVTLYQHDNHVYRLRLSGHADYDEYGYDIVCSAISMLTINTINSIESLTDEPLELLEEDSNQGIIDVIFPRREQGEYAPEAELLLKSLILGYLDIKNMYGEKHITINKQ